MELCANLLKKLNKTTVISNFLASFCFYLNNFPSWIRIRILNADPDLGGKMNADPCRSGSAALPEENLKNLIKKRLFHMRCVFIFLNYHFSTNKHLN